MKVQRRKLRPKHTRKPSISNIARLLETFSQSIQTAREKKQGNQENKNQGENA
jgi:hypothetical protein